MTKPFWKKEWLEVEYTSNNRSMADIAKQFGVGESAIWWWFKKHGIKARSVSEIRSRKHWGASGFKNPMYGRTGNRNPRYRDGSSPERQKVYSTHEWRTLVGLVYKRDGYKCQKCGIGNRSRRFLHAHHIKPWAGYEEKRKDPSNLVTLCRHCHIWVHSKANVGREYL